MLISGAHNLYNHHYEVDKLNVFPVPDGDTGTNMNLTMMNGIKELNGKNYESFKEFGTVFTRGLIMGARGNSGVILSQIFRGFFYNFIHNKNYATVEFFSPSDILKALLHAKDFAYKAVMKPVEGTILTVINDGATNLNHLCAKEKDSVILFEKLLELMQESLKTTPELLPILKKVNVVDSGGAGLVFIFEGMLYGLKHNKSITLNKKLTVEDNTKFDFVIKEEEFGYCTELIINLYKMSEKEFDLNKTRNDLEAMDGQSIVVVEDQELIKVHVHTLKPGQILDYLQKYGDFLTVKVENMTEQAKAHAQTVILPRKLNNKYALIACVPGKGIEQFFKEELNVTATIFYSKRINPSTDDFLKVIERVDAKTVYILPNDSNLLLAAEQAKKLEKKSKIFVLPTKNIAQGMRAALNFNQSLTSKENNRNMTNEIKNVTYGYISIADRDVEIDDVNIRKNTYVAAGILRRDAKLKIYASNKNLISTVKKIFDKII
ncbi:dihydroxyacetone glyceraldehyde kinase [Lasius niger]|uniref:Dihydroxyacetone glyceraldehyde kinase n=1 Tax=Lasius niger TaxID=67767 RepID=A0A0J7NX10_LASNI|nr:dihydroxyacetone glyceraldehyde kinase [Lasius niger]